MSESGLEPAEGSGGSRRGAGGQDKKKVIILVVLLVIGAGIGAYQFLIAGGAQTAAANTSSSAKSAASKTGDVDSILMRLENTAANGDDALGVARVEQLVKEFDTYVHDRQVPLAALRANPFAVRLAEEAKSQPEAPPDDAAQKALAEAEARRKAVQDKAAQLVLGSVMVAGSKRWATISGKLCTVGDDVMGFRVEAIAADGVTVACEDQKFDLRLAGQTGGGRGKG